jgi:plastocyanin
MACLATAVFPWVHAALAVPVTVEVTTPGGGPAADAVIVLDPATGMPPPTKGTATVDQINKRFTPRVTVVRTGTSITFPNSDHIRHQVYSFSPAKPFTLKLYAGTPPTAVMFDHPGLAVLGCNIHDTMVAFVAVVDTPYFGKTAADGRVTVDVPAGRYRLRIWHPDAAAPIADRELAVAADALTVPVALDVSESAAQPAAWPD